MFIYCRVLFLKDEKTKQRHYMKWLFNETERGDVYSGWKKTPWHIALVLNIDPIQKRKSFLSME